MAGNGENFIFTLIGRTSHKDYKNSNSLYTASTIHTQMIITTDIEHQQYGILNDNSTS
jgi:hypothetical protein